MATNGQQGAQNIGVLVTGIGGNVGQGILRVVRQHFTNLRLIGTDINSLTAGHRFCDAFHRVPFSLEPSYGETMAHICREEKVGLIIASTDYEVLYLGKAADQLPSLIASPPSTSSVFLDKRETHRAFVRAGLPFARSWLPSEFRSECEQMVVKPREGRGSRGLHFNPPAVEEFDDSFLVQERLVGVEITVAFYVDRRKRLHGFIVFERSLAAGMTERCQITHAYDGAVRNIIDGMMVSFDLRGPRNVQAIVTESGDVVPFEVNCRYSGTSSIRAQLGFPDVAYGLQEYLLNEDPTPFVPQARGSAVRIFMDVIYPGRDLDEIEPGKEGSFVF